MTVAVPEQALATVAAVSPDEGSVIVRRLAAGDEAALRDVYRQHRDAVRGFANRLVGDAAAAEDLVHEVFVALPRAARRFRGEVSLRQFLFSIAVNHVRHHLRGAVRRRRAQLRMMDEPQAAPALPSELVQDRQLGRALVAALDELPLDQRVAFVLCEIEDRSSADAARIANTSDPNIRVRLFKARRSLRRLLAAWHRDGEPA